METAKQWPTDHPAHQLALQAALTIKLECGDGHELVAMRGGSSEAVEDFVGSHSTGKYVQYEFTCPRCDKKAWLRLRDRTEEFELRADSLAEAARQTMLSETQQALSKQ